MHPRAEEFADEALTRYGIEVDIHEFPEGTKTANDAAEAIGCSVAQIASTILFMVDDDPVVVITSGANRVSEDRLATLLDGDTVQLGSPDDVRSATGWSIGGVPPFCHDTTLEVLMDQTLVDHETVWAAAGTPAAVFPMAPEKIRDLADGTTVDITD